MIRSTRYLAAFSLAFIMIISLFACGDNELKAIFIVDGEEYAVCTAKSQAEFQMPPEPTKEGFTFGGWYLGETLSGGAFTADALVSGKPITVYAKWTELHIHVEGELKIFKAPTCFEEGIAYTECTECAHKMSTVFVEKLEHVSSDWLIETESTCTVSGKRIKECTLCSTVLESEDIPLAPHTEGAETVVTPAKCEEKGLAVIKCSVCEQTVSERELSATGHTEGDAITETEPTCLEKGLAVIKCASCDILLETRELDSLGHAKRTLEGRLPTETRDGITEGVDCSRCFLVLTPQERIPAEITGCDMQIGKLALSGTTFSATLANSEDTLSLVGEIKINEAASFCLSKNSDGSEEIDDLSIPLSYGSNTFYITVTSGEESIVYTVSVYRKNAVTVTFLTEGSSVEPITLDEGDALVSIPVSDRPGYDFDGWDIDLTLPITESVSANALFTARDDTPYTVIYYAHNGTDYEEKHRESLVGTTDTLAIIPDYDDPHYTLNEELTDAPLLIKGDGMLVLSVYLDPVTYTITFETGCAAVIDPITVIYGTVVTSVPTPYRSSAHSFDGWYIKDSEIRWIPGEAPITSDLILEAHWSFMTPPDVWG